MGGQFPPQEPADHILLARFTEHGNDDAFAALMRRHGPYILGVCRRVTVCSQDAEDLFQACFLELVRRASSIRQGACVAAWLHTVAVRLGRKGSAGWVRRRKLEMSAGRPEAADSSPSADVTWREVSQALEEEGRLPLKLRLPVIVCLFEEQTQEQAAVELGITPAALKSRLRRGRELLRTRLIRRGISGAVLASVLAVSNASAAVPAALAHATVRGAGAVVHKTGLAGVVSPGAAALVGSALVPAGWAAVMVAALALTLGAVVGTLL
jgi:RNA polymerase sigma factor (sigma-70 family)